MDLSATLGRAAAGLLVLGGVACHQPVAEAVAGPNVILIVVDTLRADHLGSYGYERATDEPLGRFLEESTRFADCRAPASWTVPSTASLLTGLLPARHGVVDHGTALSPDTVTLAEELQRAGWQTAGFSHNHNVSAVTHFDQGFERFEAYPGGATAYPDISRLTARATDWLETEVEGRFLLYMQPMNVHGPYMVPDGERDALLGHEPSDDFRYYGRPMKAILKRGEIERRAEVDDALVRSLVDQYDTAVHYSMDQLGAFLEELDDLGYYDSSYVILTADHGEELFDHGGFSHGYSLYDEVLHVPLFIKAPFQREARVVEDGVSLVDVFPTLIERLGLREPYPLDGLSLSDALDGRGALPERTFLADASWTRRCSGQAIEHDGLKLLRIDGDYSGRHGVLELYDLARDPHERRDLLQDDPARAQRMEQLLDETLRAATRHTFEPGPRVDEAFDRSTLEALGYL